MQALRDPPKDPGVLYPTFGDPTFLTPPNDFEDLTLQLTMELEDTLRDGIGIPYVPPPPIRSKDEAAALRKASEKSDKSRDKKGKSRDKKKSNGNVDIEDLDGGMGNAESGPSGSGAGALYAQGGIGPDQEAFFGWRIPDARRVVGVEIEDLNDRPSKWGSAGTSTLRAAAASDKLDKDLLFLDKAYFPPGLWDAHFEDDERAKRGKRKRDEMREDGDLDMPDLDNEDDRDSNASSREDEDQFADEEEMDHEDYDANYFDNGEGDDDEGGGDGGDGDNNMDF